jgi:hypothetical protein
MARARPRSSPGTSPSPTDPGRAFVSTFSLPTRQRLGNSGRPGPLPEIEIVSSVRQPDGSRLVTYTDDRDGGEIRVPAGIELTEEHLGAEWANFTAGVYQSLFDDCAGGHILSVADVAIQTALGTTPMAILRTSNGVWWALLMPSKARVTGCGFLAIQRKRLLVQSAAYWRLDQAGLGTYTPILAAVKAACAMPLFSDVHISVMALRSWQRRVRDGRAAWDEGEGRFRLNPPRVLARGRGWRVLLLGVRHAPHR